MGLAYLASVARDAGHEVTIYDAEHARDGDTLPWEEAALRFDVWLEALRDSSHPLWLEAERVIAEAEPDLVGISVLSVKTQSAGRIAGIAKRIAPHAPVVVGGDHPTVWPEKMLQNPDIDLVVRHEGEAAFAELLGQLETETVDTMSLPGGCSRRRTDGRIDHAPDRPLIEDLDTVAFPHLDALADLESYRPVDLGAVIGMRGCPYDCSFCGVTTVWTHRVRKRSPHNVVDELELLDARFAPPYFSFRDATFTLDRGWAIDVSREITRRGLGRPWEAVTRADKLDRELLEVMAEAGCRTLRIGVESGSPEVLASMNKSTDLEPVRVAARMMNEMGLYWSAYFLFGTPHETGESIAQTLDFIDEIDPPFVTVARYSPIPGTPYYAELEEAGRIHSDIDWSCETNQRLASDYLLDMPPAEFEPLIRDASARMMDRNAAKSMELGAVDGRLKVD
jgi:radical SAM superfamily enzyme YgiQ (UPF0313 family)